MSARNIFGSQMRRLREQAGFTRNQLAELTPYKAASIKSFEQGHRTPTVALAVALEKIFDTKGLFVAMQEEAEQETTPFGDLKYHEQRAKAIRIWDMRVMPGLLQTEEYAVAVLGDDEDVATRLERQGIFTREEPPDVRVIIAEGVLYLEIGGLAVLRRQLEWLIRPDAPWTIQIMPDMAGAHNGVPGPLTLLEFDDEEPVAFLDTMDAGTVVDDQIRVAEKFKTWEKMTGEALSPDLSREMIRAVIADLPED